MADYKEQGLYQEGNSLFDDIFAFGDLEVQNINVVGIITAKTFSGVDATSLKDDGGTVKIQATSTGATHSGRAVFNEVELQGKVYDSDGDFGTSGQVLSSDGTDIEWVNAGSLTAGAAAEVGVTAVNTNATHFITFVDSSSGNENIRVDTDLTYNPSTNTLGGTNISSLYVTGNLRIGGQLKDGDNAFGSSGQVLSSDGTDTRWVNAGSLTAGAASEVGITAVNDNSSHFLAFLDSSSGNDNIKVDTNLTYNPSTNLLSLGGISFSGTISGGTSVSATNLSGNLTGTIQTAAQTNITSVGTLTGLTVDGNLILDSTSNYLHIKGALYDKDGQSGSADQVLVSTGTQVDWKDATTLTASNSQKITITESDTNTAFPITFSAAPGQSGGNTLLSDNQFTYNASSNIVTAGTFSGSGASLTSLNASSLQSGTVPDARIPNLNASKINAGTLGTDRIPNLNASKINAGTLGTDRIPNLAASKITSGTLGTDRIPSLAASKITSGTLGTDRIPSLAASKITSGQFNAARIPTLNQDTTGSAASLTTARTIAGSSFNGTANININYNNLTNKPTIPTNNNQLTNGRGFITATDVRSMNESASPGQSSTSSTAFQNKVTLSINTVSNSRVLVIYSFEIKHSNTNNHGCIAQVNGSNVSLVGGNVEERRNDNGFERFTGSILDISSHTGTRTYRIQFRATNNSGQIQNASLVAIEMSV